MRRTRQAFRAGPSDGGARVSRHWKGGLWLAGLIVACLGCAPEPPLLYCGAGIRPPVAELVEAFNREQGTAIVCDYRGSEVLLSSVQLTGKGDLYMPGDAYYVELAEKKGLVAAKQTVCYFVPVILVRKGNPKNVRTLEDLTREDVKVGLGDPQFCAIGRNSSKILENNGILEKDVNVTFRSPTVNELGNHIELGSLDAVIVWDAVAAYVVNNGAGELVRIPRRRNVISTVVVGVLKSSRHPETAAKFVEFVTSERGREVFRRHGYTTAPPE